jgi:site-specific DNA recombinase
MERQILDSIKKLHTDKTLLPKIIAKPSVDNSFAKELADIDRQEDRLLTLYQSSGMPIEKINERIKDLQTKKANLLQLVEKQKRRAVPSLPEVRHTLQNFLENWDSVELNAKIALLDQLIEKVVVHPAELDIYWTFIPAVDD